MTARLFCKTGQLAGSDYKISNEATIGTSSDNTIVLYPKIISGHHARIAYDDNEKCYFLEDLGSRNGTKLDGMRVTEKEKLGNLNVITFSNMFDFLFQVVDSEQPVAAEKKAEPAKLESEIDERKTVVGEDFGGIPAGIEEGAGSVDEGKTRIDQNVMPTPDIPEQPQEEDAQKTVADVDFAQTPDIPESDQPDTPDVQRTVVDQSDVPVPNIEAGQTFNLVLTFEGMEESFKLKEGENILGRAVENDICIDDPSISRRHASIIVKSNEATVKDLGSKNHTFVEKQKVDSETAIQPGTRIRFGEIEAVLNRA
ncbi:FHA domain-containing protein [candidate division KSB1 bacterium]|nr:FHA domain-containing protein [candidate division KSB1 bacterium]NIR70742.1 FHA domain-containing protein [candidate division KSB1 bacterium]NIS24600.1 FHA domain-containing protein [candidate division KSB1 bacterium]NIT71509.1 FHA domain-containing protein [candidate division KSB1 bacterium]NIU25200.1 FHA domain-containing protein [candidate division KSB1 bacterium]